MWVVTVQYQDNNTPMFVDDQFLLSWRPNRVLLLTQNLYSRVLAFQPYQCLLKWSFITIDIGKTLSRGRTVTVQYQDCKTWTVTVQCLLISYFDCLKVLLVSKNL